MQQAPYLDPEDPDAKGFEFTDQSIRKGFIRKVFSILTVSQYWRYRESRYQFNFYR